MEKGINRLQFSNRAEMAGGSIKLKVAVQRMLFSCVLTQKLRMERLTGARLSAGVHRPFPSTAQGA